MPQYKYKITTLLGIDAPTEEEARAELSEAALSAVCDLDYELVKPKVVHIVALDKNNTIGLNGKMPWYISVDLMFFQQQTKGHTCIVGNKTYQSLPKSVREDPERQFIPVSRSGSNLAEVMQYPPLHPNTSLDKVFIIGGAEIYKQTLFEADELLITQIDGEFEGDTFYPDYKSYFKMDFATPWFTENGVSFRFTRWVRT